MSGKDDYSELAYGYSESIRRGLSAARAFISSVSKGAGTREQRIERLKYELLNAEAVLIGAGAGLSASAGFTYSGERFNRYFFDFIQKFGITDMYSGGFYPFPDAGTRWAWWARHIYFNRYIKSPKPVYEELGKLVEGRDYFVVTTNVDHRFQASGFDKARLFYTQGDYGLFQSFDADGATYDNEAWVMRAMEAMGFVRGSNGEFEVPEDKNLSLRLPDELIPLCPDGKRAALNLRSDDTFVEDEGWRLASARYAKFIDEHKRAHVLYLELGVGSNTPVIIKFPFWDMTASNPRGVYACINYGEAFCPKQIENRSICLDADIGTALSLLK